MPGFLPAARLLPRYNILTQQHESLHYHFNVLTTSGNALALLAQLISALPSHWIADQAAQVCDAWHDALLPQVEAVISYVTLNRARRRMTTPLSSSEYEALLQPSYVDGWRRWVSVYDALPIHETSRDALAMQVAIFCFNIPVYPLLRDPEQLQRAATLVTPEAMGERFQQCHKAISGAAGRCFLENYEKSAMWVDLNDPETHKRELASVYAFLHAECPSLQVVEPASVPESKDIAAEWNNYFRQHSLPLVSPIRMDMMPDPLTSEEYTTIVPPEPSVHDLNEIVAVDRGHGKPSPRAKIGAVLGLLSDDVELGAISFIHRNLGERPFILSAKYGRVLQAGECYVRSHFAKLGNGTEEIKVLPKGLFFIASQDDLVAMINGEQQHPRHIWIESMRRSTQAVQPTPPEISPERHYWRVAWGMTGTQAESLLANDSTMECHWFQHMPALEAAFLLVGSRADSVTLVLPLTMASCNRVRRSLHARGIAERPPRMSDSLREYGLWGLTHFGF